MMRFVQRVFGSAVLDVGTYEDVEADESSTWQAMVVVVLSALAAGVGAKGFTETAIAPFAIAAIALLAWAAWALLTFEIGSRLLAEPQTRVDVGQLMRTLGFSSSPGLLRAFGVIPDFALPMFLLSAVWMLATMVVAVKQALDYTTTARAVAVCGLGWLLTIIVIAVIGLVWSPVVF